MKPSLHCPDTCDPHPERNLIELISLVLQTSAASVGGAASLNELLVTHHVARCTARGDAITVTNAARSLGMPKATVSRILTDMRSRGLTVEDANQLDGRSHFIRLTDDYLERIRQEMREIVDWCQKPENALT